MGRRCQNEIQISKAEGGSLQLLRRRRLLNFPASSPGCMKRRDFLSPARPSIYRGRSSSIGMTCYVEFLFLICLVNRCPQGLSNSFVLKCSHRLAIPILPLKT
jgi:hypothetical protein